QSSTVPRLLRPGLPFLWSKVSNPSAGALEGLKVLLETAQFNRSHFQLPPIRRLVTLPIRRRLGAAVRTLILRTISSLTDWARKRRRELSLFHWSLEVEQWRLSMES